MAKNGSCRSGSRFHAFPGCKLAPSLYLSLLALLEEELAEAREAKREGVCFPVGFLPSVLCPAFKISLYGLDKKNTNNKNTLICIKSIAAFKTNIN